MEATRATEYLLRELGSGSRLALAELYDRYAGIVYRIGFRLTGSPADAADIVQDVFLALPKSVSVVDEQHFQGWISQVTARQALLILRARRREVRLTMPSWLFSQGEPVLTRIDLERAIHALPEKLRQVFVLKEIEGFSHAETAELLGIGIGASEVSLHRARARLRRLLTRR